jgi:hypothetical protein
MPELGPYGSVRGARGNSRPYRESEWRRVKTTLIPTSDMVLVAKWGCAESIDTILSSFFDHLHCEIRGLLWYSRHIGLMPSYCVVWALPRGLPAFNFSIPIQV